MMNEQTISKSKYIIQNEKSKGHKVLPFVFLFALFVLPQYFGVQVAGFDLTALRMAMIVMLLYILESKIKVKDFADQVKRSSYTPYLIAYFTVLLYTMVLRVSINTLLQSLIEFICMYICIYLVRTVWGVGGIVKIINGFMYLLTLQGLIEYAMKHSLFAYLETIPGLYTGAFFRSGSYRIMGPSNHSLAYGLILITMFPLACWDKEKNQVNILRKPVLLVLVFMNVLLTGSRSTLALFVMEMIVLLFLGTKENIKRAILIFIIACVALAGFLAVARNTDIAQYILRQITSLIDEALGTQYAAYFGAEVNRLTSSSEYRELLPKIFFLNWLNPLLGRGIGRGVTVIIDGVVIKSIDNFYVCQYIRYAYPGLFAYLALIFTAIYRMAKCGFKKKSAIAKCLMVGTVFYFVNLWWMDALQTLKYAYILLAIFDVVYEESGLKQEKKQKDEKRQSKYIKGGKYATSR